MYFAQNIISLSLISTESNEILRQRIQKIMSIFVGTTKVWMEVSTLLNHSYFNYVLTCFQIWSLLLIISVLKNDGRTRSSFHMTCHHHQNLVIMIILVVVGWFLFEFFSFSCIIIPLHVPIQSPLLCKIFFQFPRFRFYLLFNPIQIVFPLLFSLIYDYRCHLLFLHSSSSSLSF